MSILNHIGHTVWCLGGIYINICKLNFSAVEELWNFISIHFRFQGVCIHKPTWRNKEYWLCIPQQLIGIVVTLLLLFTVTRLLYLAFN